MTYFAIIEKDGCIIEITGFETKAEADARMASKKASILALDSKAVLTASAVKPSDSEKDAVMKEALDE